MEKIGPVSIEVPLMLLGIYLVSTLLAILAGRGSGQDCPERIPEATTSGIAAIPAAQSEIGWYDPAGAGEGVHVHRGDHHTGDDGNSLANASFSV